MDATGRGRLEACCLNKLLYCIRNDRNDGRMTSSWAKVGKWIASLNLLAEIMQKLCIRQQTNQFETPKVAS